MYLFLKVVKIWINSFYKFLKDERWSLSNCWFFIKIAEIYARNLLILRENNMKCFPKSLSFFNGKFRTDRKISVPLIDYPIAWLIRYRFCFLMTSRFNEEKNSFLIKFIFGLVLIIFLICIAFYKHFVYKHWRKKNTKNIANLKMCTMYKHFITSIIWAWLKMFTKHVRPWSQKMIKTKRTYI